MSRLELFGDHDSSRLIAEAAMDHIHADAVSLLDRCDVSGVPRREDTAIPDKEHAFILCDQGVYASRFVSRDVESNCPDAIDKHLSGVDVLKAKPVALEAPQRHAGVLTRRQHELCS
ncbi:MAG: hypothetical protein H6835_10925 [Planctomycetes bacterium]|nr:hypothetical protein [Planctomycetota bacterium]